MSISSTELARRLKVAREACQMRQEDVARHLGVSRSTIAQIELGNRAVTSIDLDKLAYLYGRDIRQFLSDEFHEEDAIVALFRRHPEISGQEGVVGALQKAVALGREITNLERILGVDRDLTVLAAYPVHPPQTKWEAVQQGERIATEERRRLGLGNAPLPNLADLLETQGVRTAQLPLPDDLSGLTLVEPEVGVLVVVNNHEPAHSYVRRRFSYAHEYCHVLLDREQRGTISRTGDRESLIEVRANAFAAALLMPDVGVEEFIHALAKGRASRLEAEIFDEEQALRARARPDPGSQIIQMHDVALLAHHFAVSRISALYRLRNLRLVSQAELEFLMAQEHNEVGKAVAKLLDLPEPDREQARNEFRHRFLALALEAFRRAEITEAKLRKLASMVDVAGSDLDAVLARAGLGQGDAETDDPLSKE